MKKSIILSTIMLSLLASSVISANNVKQNNNNIKSHQQIENSIKQKQTEEASKQKQAEEANKQKQINNQSLNMNKNQITNILNNNQLDQLSGYYVILNGYWGDSIIIFNTKSEKNKFNKIVTKTEKNILNNSKHNACCDDQDDCQDLIDYLNNHHCIAKFFNSRNQSMIINTYNNYSIDNNIILEFQRKTVSLCNNYYSPTDND